MADPGTCFSSVVVWRCSALRILENQLLIIGPALQLLFSLLVFTNSKPTHRFHFFLVAEGLFSFLFALLELLSRLPAAQVPSIFNAIDITLAASAFLPLLLYSAFIYFLVRAHVIPSIPERFHNIFRALLLVFIPTLVALAELSSFVGVERTTFTLPNTDRPLPAIGFQSGSTNQVTWQFFTSFALAVLTTFQATAFGLSFFKVIMVALNQRNIDISGADQAALYNGIGWISAGFKAGAIETVLGFASPSFGLHMTRRCLKAFSRGLLAYGAAKGASTLEGFQELIDEMSPHKEANRRSRLFAAIGRPLSNTFHHMSPTATAFHSVAPIAGRHRSPLATNPATNAPQMSEFSSLRDGAGPRPRARVTVHYAQGEAPFLEMRFSQLDMPEPDVIVEKVKSRPNSMFREDMAATKSVRSLHHGSFANNLSSNLRSLHPPPPPPSQPRDYPRPTHRANDSVPESVNTVRELASQFPGLPTPAVHVHRDRNGSIASSNSSAHYVSADTRRLSSAYLPSPVAEETLASPSVTWPSHPSDSGQALQEDPMDSEGRRRRLSSDTSMSSQATGVSAFSHRTDPKANDQPPASHEATWLHRKPFDAQMDELAQTVMAEQRDSWATNSLLTVPSVTPERPVSHTLYTAHRAVMRTPTMTKSGAVRGSVHLSIQPPSRAEWSRGKYEIDDHVESPSYDGNKLLRNVLRDDEVIHMERRF